MDSVSSPRPFGNSLSSKNDSVSDLLSSVEKIKVKATEKPISFLFDHPIQPKNLREKFLYATFEIIADKGVDALSASELIRRTKSSKGALFHHFNTIDDLCIESLNYFRAHLSLGIAKDDCETLEEYLAHYLNDSVRKMSTRYYVHLVNFFRDRAIRDERYRVPLRSLFEMTMGFVVSRIMQFLPELADRKEVFDKVIFMAMTIERVSYHRALYQDSAACDKELKQFLDLMIQTFKAIK